MKYVVKIIDRNGIASGVLGPFTDEAEGREALAQWNLTGRFVRAELWSVNFDDVTGKWSDREMLASKP